MRTKQIARDLLNHPHFETLGAMTVSQLYSALGLRSVTKPELRNKLSELRSRAVEVDEHLGNSIILVTGAYFRMSPQARNNITERDTDLIALHGRRADGILVVDSSVKHHVTLYRMYIKALTQDLEDRGGKIYDRIKSYPSLLTPGHKRDALKLLGTFNSLRDLRTLKLASGK